MNQVQLRFQSGAENCCLMEKIADRVLAFPKAMWGNKTISYMNGEFKLKNYYYSLTSFIADGTSLFHMYDFGFIKIPVLAAYLIGSVVATPLLAVGLIFKEIALKNNASSQQYHSKICKAAPLLIEAESIGKKIPALSKNIKKANDICKKFREKYNDAVASAETHLNQIQKLEIRKAEIEKALMDLKKH